eukprot:633255-Prymnesium_polylepis.1
MATMLNAKNHDEDKAAVPVRDMKERRNSFEKGEEVCRRGWPLSPLPAATPAPRESSARFTGAACAGRHQRTRTHSPSRPRVPARLSFAAAQGGGARQGDRGGVADEEGVSVRDGHPQL